MIEFTLLNKKESIPSSFFFFFGTRINNFLIASKD
jgi:hypothetical protein